MIRTIWPAAAVWTFVALLPSCVIPLAPVPATGPGPNARPVAPPPQAAPPSVPVMSAEEAARLNLVRRPIARPFGADQDGTQLVAELLADAQRQGAHAVSDIQITLLASSDQGRLACRTAIVPQALVQTRTVPVAPLTIQVQRPVSRSVTEYQYRCHMVSKPEMRTVTEYEQRCHMVSRPVTRTRTSYRSQYDYYSKSTRSVPYTETYTDHQSHQECRSEPRTRTRTEYVPRNECRSEPVTHQVTRYEFQWETRYMPPRLETITEYKLRETEPVCSLLEATAALPSSQIDAVFHFPSSR